MVKLLIFMQSSIFWQWKRTHKWKRKQKLRHIEWCCDVLWNGLSVSKIYFISKIPNSYANMYMQMLVILHIQISFYSYIFSLVMDRCARCSVLLQLVNIPNIHIEHCLHLKLQIFSDISVSIRVSRIDIMLSYCFLIFS